jgi:hypothetical protein
VGSSVGFASYIPRAVFSLQMVDEPDGGWLYSSQRLRSFIPVKSFFGTALHRTIAADAFRNLLEWR